MSGLVPGRPRPPAVAGLFYPAGQVRLRRMVKDLLDEAPAAEGPSPRGILAPHAGYIYSGPTAAVAFRAVTETPSRVVLVGPSHRVPFRGVSAGDFSAYETPLGAVPVDRAATADLLGRGLVQVLPEAHEEEHSLEVMLPFVLERWGPLPIVPLLAGDVRADEVERVLDAALRPGDLLVVSSDLSHYLSYDTARSRDRATLERVEAGDWRSLGPYDACGHRGLAGALRLAAARGWRTSVLDYRSSGDTAGDRDRVVGYGAAAFYA